MPQKTLTTGGLRPGISGDKVAFFLLGIVAVGLLQLWVVVIIQLAMGETPAVASLAKRRNRYLVRVSVNGKRREIATKTSN